MCAHRRSRAWLVVGVVVVYVVSTVVLRRRGYSGMGGRQYVRCRAGHVFRTIWVPGVSIKSVRLGWWRVQYCPVGGHWSVVSPVTDAVASDSLGDLTTVIDDIALP
jgi:hypothetical protein